MSWHVPGPRGGRAGRAVVLWAAAAACVLVLGIVQGWPAPFRGDDDHARGTTAPPTAAAGSAPGSEPGSAPADSRAAGRFSVLQVNLCLSGLAGCYDDAAYPAVVDEAVAQIRGLAPDAVTVTEGCHRDAEQIARRLDYHVLFARVRYAGVFLPCTDPAGRGSFGVAVLTRAPIVGAETEPFEAQADLEQRRWLCASTRADLDVCTAHLETPHRSAARAARDAQCEELAAVLAARSSRAFVFGGDLNRRAPCAPPGAWSRTDSAARKAPGVQHVYGGGALRDPTSEILPARFSDHDMLLVRARFGDR